MLEQLLTNPFLYSLSLTLLHFLWQGLLVATILKSVLLIIDKSKPRLRYALSGMAMLANLLLAIGTFLLLFPNKITVATSNLAPIPLTSLVNELTQQNPLMTYQELLPSILAYSLPYIAVLWLISVTALACKLLIEIHNVNNLPKHDYILPGNELLIRFNELAKQIKLATPPKLLISLKIDVPMAIGWLKPVVLLPASMVTGLNNSQLEMLLLHELAHIRRYDYAVNFLQTIIEILFFFHPSVAWVAKQMRNEREYCSDDIAVQHCGDPIAYAHTLADTASLCAQRHQHTIPDMAMAASGGDLKERVLRLVDHHCAPSNNVSKWLAAISIMLFITLILSNQVINNQLISASLPNQWQSNSQLPLPLIDNDYSNYSPQDNQNKNSIARQLLKVDKVTEQHTPSISTLKNTTNIIPNPEVKIASLVNTSNNEVISDLPIETDRSQIKAIISLEQNKNEMNNLEHELLLEANTLAATKNKPELVANLQSLNTIEKMSIDSQKFKARLDINNTIEHTAKIIQKTNQNTGTDYSVNLASLRVNDNKHSDTKNLDIKSSGIKSLYQQKLVTLATDNRKYLAITEPVDIDIDKNKESKPYKLKNKEVVWYGAKRLSSVDPVYPSLAKRKGIEIEVKVHFTIDEYGQVKDIKFAQKSRVNYFKSAIRTAIRKWRYTPAQKNKQAIESQMSKIFSFSLQA